MHQRHSMPMMLLSTVLCLLAVVYPCAADGSTAQFQRLLVLHRHGARGPMGVVNGTLICSYPYCQINDEGKSMCRSLGRYLSATYNNTAMLQLPSLYNVSFMSSVSTDYSRVVVSAEAMVMGLYEGATTEPLPFVDFVPITADIPLVMWHSWPTWVLRGTYQAEVHVDDSWVRSFIGEDHLTRLGDYFGIQGVCSTTPTDCIGFVQDSIACNVSAGVNNTPPWVFERWDDYRVVVSKFLARILGYDPSIDYSRNIGSLGFPFATAAMSFLAPTPVTAGSLMRFQHFAAHDWTLIAVYSALGIWNPSDAGNTTFVPRFTETLILEQWLDGGSMYIRGKWGYPEQTVGNHTFTFRDANLTCRTAEGVNYGAFSSADHWCLADDLWRFVNTTAPQSDQGVCYATDDMLQSQDCDKNHAPPAGSPCYFYRVNCPNAPCGSTNGALADPARGYMCQTNQLGKNTPFLAATIVALVAPALLAGAIGGFYFTERIRKVLWGSKNGEQQPLAQEDQQ